MIGPKTAGVLAGLGAAAIWGGMYVVTKYVLAYVPPLTLVLMREVIGAAALFAVVLAAHAPLVARRDLPFAILLGFVGLFVSIVTQYVGTDLSNAASGALITSATPAFMVVFAWPILGERLTTARVAGLVLATAGVALTVLLGGGADPTAGRDPAVGNLLLLAAALTWALYSTLGRIAAARYPVVVTTAYATAVGALFTALCVPFELATTPLVSPPPLAWLGILYLGAVSTAGAFYLWNKSIALLGAGLPALLFFAQPVVGGLLGAILLGETLTATFWAGGVLIAAGVLVTARDP